jgi:hypothetical protein
MAENQPVQEVAKSIYAAGRKSGLAIGALAACCVVFLNLLGMEKVLLAMVLAIVAVWGTTKDSPARRLSLAAAVAACVCLAGYVVLTVVFWNDLIRLLKAATQAH